MAKLISTEILRYHLEKLKAAFVPAEAGKGLSTNDFTDADKARLDSIPEKTLSGATITLDQTSFSWTGEPQCPEIESVRIGEETLTENVDYVNLTTEAIEPGTYAVALLGIGQYGGQASQGWEIGRVASNLTADSDTVAFKGEFGEVATFEFNLAEDAEVHLTNEGEQFVTAELQGHSVKLTSVAKGDAVVKLSTDATDHCEASELLIHVHVQTLSVYSWTEIAEIAAAGQASAKFALGDQRELKIGEDTYHAEIIDFDHDDLDQTDAKYSDETYNSGSKKAAITFLLRELYDDDWKYCSEGEGKNNWEISALRTTAFARWKANIDPDCTGAIRTVTKRTGKYSKDDQVWTTTTTADQLFALSGIEMGESINTEAVEGSAYAQTIDKKRQSLDGSITEYWLRSPCWDPKYTGTGLWEITLGAFCVDTEGELRCGRAGDEYLGVDLAFCI